MEETDPSNPIFADLPRHIMKKSQNAIIFLCGIDFSEADML